MKKVIYIFFITIGFIGIANAQKGYNITVKSPQLSKGLVYLLYQNGPNSFPIEDSMFISNRQVVFQKSTPLPRGIYTIFYNDIKKSFQILVDNEQNLNITVADTADMVKKIIIPNSVDNKIYYEYLNYVNKIEPFLTYWSKKQNDETDLIKKQMAQKNYQKYLNQLDAYRRNIQKKYPKRMLAVLFDAMQEPKPKIANPITRNDSIANYYHYRDHFWDGISFMDDRVIRTPFFKSKLENYYRNLMPQIADTIIADINYKMLLARNNPEMFKFLLNWYTDEYFNPKYLGLDAILVELFNKYHSQNLSPWLNEKQKKQISDRVYMTMGNLIGLPASEISVLNLKNDKPIGIYDVQSNYTLLVFWDPTCGHCKTEMPRLDSFYKALWKDKKLTVFAVLSESDYVKEWKEFIQKNNLNDFIHAYQTKEMAEQLSKNNQANFKQLYDVIQTPALVLLDKDKKIKLKKVGLEVINEFLEKDAKK